jgi:hypothetical protein
VRSVGVARTLVVLASVGMVLALAAGYARRAVVDSDQFANRATVALSDDNVKSLIAERITDDVVLKNQQDLLAARPIIQSVASGIVGSRAFTNLFRSAVRDVHRALFARDEHTFTLTVADVGTVLAAALQQVRPSLASQVESVGSVAIVKRDVGDVTARVVNVADTVRLLALLLGLVSLALLAAAIAISPRRRHTIVEFGVATATAGVMVVVAYSVVRSIAVHHVEGAEDRAAAGAVWDAYLGDLRTLGWIVAGSGAVIAAAASSLIRPIDLGEPLRRAFAWVTTEPQRPALRALRGVVLVLLGLVVLVEHDAVVQLVLTAVGVYLIYEGISAVLRLIYRPDEEEERPRPRLRPVAWLMQRRALVTAAIATVVIVGVTATFLGTGATTTAAPALGACDGHDELCDRPLAKVALPATHNSMSVPLPGWYSSEQERPIADQLRDGTPTTPTGCRTAGCAPTSAATRSWCVTPSRTASAPRPSMRRCASATGWGSPARARAACTCATRSASSAPARFTRCSTTSTTSSWRIRTRCSSSSTRTTSRRRTSSTPPTTPTSAASSTTGRSPTPSRPCAR